MLIVALLMCSAAALFQLPSYCQFPQSTRYLMVVFSNASECIRFTQYSNVLITGGQLAQNCSIATVCFTTSSSFFSTNFSTFGVLSLAISGSNAQVYFSSQAECARAANSSITLTATQLQPIVTCSSTGRLTLGSPQQQETQSNQLFALLDQPTTLGLVDIVI